ncbi:MAG: hypothetical protein IKN38_05215 [Clostridia bacterium]|nr:hypothetical protein [Clostridia bacterium]
MATVIACALLLALVALVQAVLYIISIPFRIIRAVFGVKRKNKAARYEDEADQEEFDFWLDDQGL